MAFPKTTFPRQFGIPFPPATVLSGGAAWTPLSLNPTQWYDFSDISKLYQDSSATTPVASDGDPIGYCTDMSGAGAHIIQVTTAQKPTYKVNIKNSLSVAYFDGGDKLHYDSIARAQPCTIYGVLSVKTGTDPFDRVFSYATNGLESDTGVAANTLSVRAQAAGIPTVSITLDTWQLATYVYNGASSTLKVNAASTSGDAGTGVGGGTFVLGDRPGYDVPFLGYWSEFIAFDGVHAAATQTAVQSYLNAKWAVY